MGTYVLIICLFNFVAGFAAAMFMHNPRIFRLRRRASQTPATEAAPEQSFSLAEPVRKRQWILPAAWKAALSRANLETEASPDTVLHGLLHWQNVYRLRMLELERRLRAADEKERVNDSLHPLYERTTVANREFMQNLRESSKLLQSLEFPQSMELDDRIHDYMFEIESACHEETVEEILLELKTHGVRGRIDVIRRAVDAGHPFRDYVEMLIANRLLDSGELDNAPDSWQRQATSDLRNRIGFVQTLERFFESETEPFQICSFHLDRFRKINERIGVSEGDELLQAFAVLLRDLLPGEDCDQRMARLFGATVAVFLPQTDRNGAEVMAERIRQSIEASSIELLSGAIECTVSCAIIEASERQKTEEVIERISPIIAMINKSGGNRTGAETDAGPEMIAPRAFQVEARVVRHGSVELATSLTMT